LNLPFSRQLPFRLVNIMNSFVLVLIVATVAPVIIVLIRKRC
jgi:capsule polysaccharide export protein KpsE/RkpR